MNIQTIREVPLCYVQPLGMHNRRETGGNGGTFKFASHRARRETCFYELSRVSRKPAASVQAFSHTSVASRCDG